MSRFPPADRIVAFEYNCQLVHEAAARRDATASSPGLGFPDVQIPADHQSEFLEGSVPVIHVPASLCTQLQSPKKPRSASASQQPEASTSGRDSHHDKDDTQEAGLKSHGSHGKGTWQGLLQDAFFDALEWIKQQAWGIPRTLPPGPPKPPPFCWHCHRSVLAMADEEDRVHVFDLTKVSGSTDSSSIDACLVLYHEFQRKIGAVAWRPRSGTVLAVGCQQGVCLWTVGRGPMGATALSKSAPGGGAWMTFLKMPSASRVDSLSFSPDGAFLAACCWDSPHLAVWDVATGVSQLVRSGNAALLSVVWSPCGNYIFAAGRSSFYLWETQSWRCEAWDCGSNGSVSRAAWSPDSQSLMLAFHKTSSLQAIFFVEPAPSLKNQILPVALPECLPIRSVHDAERAESSRGTSCIQDFAWDKTGQRLAVLLEGSHPAAGTVAVYDVTTTPLITARFIGYARLPPLPGSSLNGYGSQARGADMAFMPSFTKGALLSVRREPTTITNIPLHFTPMVGQ